MRAQDDSFFKHEPETTRNSLRPKSQYRPRMNEGRNASLTKDSKETHSMSRTPTSGSAGSLVL
uniref:Uncharacterized protein n=1 Tax=Anguilla anguilla TaxID=7936 RepID=A0A0E9RC80_ANGAN